MISVYIKFIWMIVFTFLIFFVVRSVNSETMGDLKKKFLDKIKKIIIIDINKISIALKPLFEICSPLSDCIIKS